FAVGAARDYRIDRRTLRRPVVRDPALEAPIWYISTAICANNLPGLHKGLTDTELSRRENRVVDDVLSVLPHRVMYKPYPPETARYGAEETFVARAAAAPNIALYQRKVDLRYLLAGRRDKILVSGVPSS